jgi:hypothetical protein
VALSALLLAADIISTVEFNGSGDLLATGDKGGRVVVFQREQEVSNSQSTHQTESPSPACVLAGKEALFPVLHSLTLSLVTLPT